MRVPLSLPNNNSLRKLKPARNEIIVSGIIVLILSGLAIVNLMVSRNASLPDSQNNQITVETNPEVINGSQDTANLNSTVNWQKQVSAGNVDQLQDGTIIEEIGSDQEYIFDTLNLPEGWSAEWSYDPVGTPEESRTYTSTTPGPDDKPTYIKINTGTKDTFKPSVSASVSQPIADTALDSGKNPSAPVLHKKKIYVIMRGVEAATDPTNTDSSLYTIDCYDILLYERCPGYPGYFSSDSGGIAGNPENQSITSGTKDLNTGQYFQQIFDDGTYGNEGRLYFPAQKGGEYGIGCINVVLAVNCGFTSYGSSPAPVSGDFPTLIYGFVRKGSKFYGHANDEDMTYQRIICFDMNSDGNGADASCSGFDDENNPVLSSAPTYILSEHFNKYRNSGSHVMSGDKLFWTVDYRYAIQNILTSSQSNRRTVMFCYDVEVQARCPGTGGNEGWSHNFGGAPAVPSNALQQDHTTSLFVWRQAGGVDHAVCLVIGVATDLIYFDPNIRCFTVDNGIFQAGGGGTGFPDGFFPSVWWPAYAPFVPWKMGPNHLDTTNESGQPITYFPLYSTASGNIGSAPENGATLCYNWETQQPCEDFGYKVRYWFDINDGQSADVGYAFDGSCVWAVGNANFLWSFDPREGEFPCRASQTELGVSIDVNEYFCDGADRVFEWDKIRLSSKTNLYNFDTLQVTVKNAANGTPIPGYENVDIRENGFLDISGIDYSSVPELDLEVVPTVFNTSPWHDGKTPKVNAILNTDNVQYCFQTKPKEICDLQQLVTETGAIVTTDTDTITGEAQGVVAARVNDNDQCYKDVRVNLSSDKPEVKAGETITYSVRVEHKGKLRLQDAANRGRISNARVELTIPDGLEFVSATSGGVKEGNKVIWNSQSFIPEEVATRRATFRPAQQVTANNKAGIVFAATTQSQLVVQASVISGDDIYQADNTASNNSAVLITNTSDEVGDGGDGEEDVPSEDDLALPPNTDPVDPGAGTLPDPERPAIVAGTSEESVTPRLLRNILPSSFANQAEQFFKVVNSAIQPIPNNVAVAVPYATIAFLVAFAVIYLYQSIQEAKVRAKLVGIQKRYKRTEELRRNYVDLTSHYLNTPIAKMQTTLEYLASTNQLPGKIIDSAKQRLARISQHAKMLLGTTESAGADKAKLSELTHKEHKLLSPGLLAPIFGVLVVTVLVNALFIWAGKYDASTNALIIQASYYVLSAIALFIAYQRYKSQKLATTATEQEIALEKQLTDSQSAFISNTSQTLQYDLVEIDQLAPSISSFQKADGFVSGLNSLKDAVGKLGYLNMLTSKNVVPTIPNQTIKDLAYEAINEVREYADERNVSLNIIVEPGLTVLVDTDGFKQLIESTVHNAIKFSNPGGTVEIKLERNDKKTIKIQIRDEGAGIPKEKLNRLFEPFGRATDSREYNYEGFGLDLYMDKLIAEQCGGSINIESEVDKGTTVTIILPS